jgi:hypothetical protein
MIIKESITINASLQKVWETFTDLTGWMKWNSVMKNIQCQGQCLTDVTAIKCCFKPFSFVSPIPVTMQIVEIIPFERIVWSARKKGLFAFHEFFFHMSEQGVQVTSKETFTGLLSRASGLLLPVKKMRALTKTFLKDLKNASES